MATQEHAQVQTYADVCDSLDKVTIKVFEVLDQVAECRGKIAEVLGQGYLQMSRARYSMGITSIGAHKLPEENIEPCVNVEYDCDSESFEIFKPCDNLKLDDPADGDKKNDETALRKRNVKSNDGDTSTSFENGEENISEALDKLKINGQENEKKNTQVKDPLKWFGVLVPQSLRQSQSSFQDSLPLICELANLQNKLEQNRTMYQELLTKKHELTSR